MNASQHVLLVTHAPDGTHGLDAVNERLQKGWRVAHVTPMGAAGSGDGAEFAALVVIERSGSEAESVLEQIEEEIEDALGDGDGGIVDLPTEPGLGRLPDAE